MPRMKASAVKALEDAKDALWVEYGSGEYDNPTSDLIAGAATRLEEVIEMLTFEEEEQ